MKALAYHDSEGNIKHLVTMNALEHIGMMLAPEAGLFVIITRMFFSHR